MAELIEPEKKKKLVAPEIIRGKQHNIVIPEDLPLIKVREFIEKRMVYEEKVVDFSETIPCFIWDGAMALQKALEETFGYALQETKVLKFLGMEFPIDPSRIQVETGFDENGDTTTASVPWGQFALPGIEGIVETGWDRTDDGVFVFKITAKVKHKDEHRVKTLFKRVREIAMKESIYRGKSIQVRFIDDDGDAIPMPKPKFVRLTDSPVFFRTEIEKAIESNILSRIRYPEKAFAATGKLKYGMLLAGRYGTGKTLCANMIAGVANENGWTFIYVQDIAELSIALSLAKSFQPAVVFGEDIERTAGVSRTDDVNKLLNTLDGLGTKSDKIITILTSNHPKDINDAMRRPGRIDLVLEVKAPDAEAAERLIRHYAGQSLTKGEDLVQAAQLLEGEIPAVIREAVERAAMWALMRTEGASAEIQAVDIELSASALIAETKLFRKEQDKRTGIEKFGQAMGEEIGKVLSREVQKIGTRIENLPPSETQMITN